MVSTALFIVIFKDFRFLLNKQGYIVNWKELEKQSLDQTINTLSMLSPFSLEEKQVLLETSDVRNALAPVVNNIVEEIRKSLSQTPPALVSDIDKDGAWITGGGSLLKQIDKKIAEELGIPINTSEDPLSSVVIGSGICLERFQDFKSILKLSPRPN